MRILAVADEIDRTLYSPTLARRVGHIDVIVSCGDLPFYYLEYLAGVLNAPTYFVFGNHGFELEHRADEVAIAEPRVGTNLDRRVVNERGLLLAGLEGCMRYNNAPRFQYTEREMRLRAGALVPQLLFNRLRRGRYLDILAVHAPPYGIHDLPDLCHTGFKSYLWLMQRFRPQYLLHGHVHSYNPRQVVATRYGQTNVVNVFPYRVIDIEPHAVYTPRRHRLRGSRSTRNSPAAMNVE
jgi:Icc-related predicted phosphoesterase